MSESKSHNSTDRLNSQTQNDFDSEASAVEIAEQHSNSTQVETGVLQSKTAIKDNLEASSLKAKLHESESESTAPENNREETFQQLKTKVAATLVGSAVMLPILAVGTATYCFGSKALNRQLLLAKRLDNVGLTEAELVRQQKLLAALVLGTGTTALLAGGIATWGTKNLLDRIARKSTEETETNFIHLNPSDNQKEILQKIVREAHSYLQCDRVIICSLTEERSGVVVAESVIPAYPKALGKTIEAPYFEVEELEKYRNGRVSAINNISEAGMIQGDLEQLANLEVKANLVTPIVYNRKLWGLLIAHQCQAPRQWQQTDIDFFSQLGRKAGLAFENVRLSDNLAHFQSLAQTEGEWTHYFTEVVQYIRQSLDRDDVLNNSVAEVRRVLRCDRVVVYSLDRERYGIVVAESVAPGYTKAYQKRIQDPCFETRYLEKYRDGRVRAIDNIYEAGMSPCYLEQLANLEVKANLVTPILNEGRLFGLLVAHQCSDTRHWQDYEIRWLSQIATQVGFALDNAQLLAKAAMQQTLAQTEGEWTHYFTEVVQYIRQSLDRDDVLNNSVAEVRRVLRCDRVVVYSLDRERYGIVVAESVAPGYTKAYQKRIQDPCFETRYLEKYRDGRVRAIDNIYEAGMSPCYLEQLANLEVKANLVTPILNEGRLFGLLVAHQCSDTRHWQDYEIRWLSQIATQVGFALDNALLLSKSRQSTEVTQLLKNFSLSIDKVEDKKQLLNIAVEQARKTLKLDRVLIYQFDAQWNGKIEAESVVAGYLRAKNLTEVPYFARDYIKYVQKRQKSPHEVPTSEWVEAIADLNDVHLSNYRFGKLEYLAVKASLVVPILQEGQLFGLLIGHQCQSTRFWETSAIELWVQIALQLETALKGVSLQAQLDSIQQVREREQQQQEQISQLIIDNKVALEELSAKISDRLAATDDLLDRTEHLEQKSTIISSNYSATHQQFNYDDLTEAQRAIAQTKVEAETLQQSYQNLYLIGSLIEEIGAEVENNTIKRPSAQLPATIDAEEITLRSLPQNAEQLAPSKTTTDSLLMNQFVGEIANLSHQISQQSLAVNDSFQKLAKFAKQLSRREW